MRRTRSSVRRDAEESGDEEQQEEDAVLVPRVAPPPPPSPPPRRRRPDNNNNNNNAMESVAVQTHNTPSSWTMTLVSRRAAPICIAITNSMTPETLGRCILQATHGYCDSDFDYDSSPVVGLFCYSTNVFMSLEHILNSAPEDHGCVFSLERKQPPPHVPWYLQWQNMVIMTSATVYLLHRYGTFILTTLWNVYQTILDYMVNLPLQEFYRNAPAVLGGWEGQSLPEICARITFHGDATFWNRNLQECQRIFSYKEQAYMRIMKPGVYLVMLVTSVYIVKMLVREYALHRRQPHNREMVETYHAIQVLTRQLNKRQQQQHHKEM